MTELTIKLKIGDTEHELTVTQAEVYVELKAIFHEKEKPLQIPRIEPREIMRWPDPHKFWDNGPTC